MAAENSGTVSATRRFDFPIERVFDAWLDPAKAGKFLFATPTGKMVRVEIDARIGGAFIFIDRCPGEEIEHVGTYLEIDRPRRLVFTLAVPKYSKQFTRVTIDIRKLLTGCDLTLTQESTLPELIDRTREGWTKIFDSLSANLAKDAAYGVFGEPGMVRFERIVPGPVERVWEYLIDSDKRSLWIACGVVEPWTGLFDHTPQMATLKERVTRFEPFKSLTLTWGVDLTDGYEVTMDLTPQG